MRATILILGGLEALVVIMFVYFMLQSSDPIGHSIAQGMAMLLAVPFALLVVPALILAMLNRWLKLALALVVLALPIAGWLWAAA